MGEGEGGEEGGDRLVVDLFYRLPVEAQSHSRRSNKMWARLLSEPRRIFFGLFAVDTWVIFSQL